MHRAPDKARLDDTWVQYYGGEKQGGIKRLSPIDDDTSVDETNVSNTVIPSQAAFPADSGHVSEPPHLAPPSLVSQAPSQKLRAASSESRSQRTLAPVTDIRR